MDLQWNDGSLAATIATIVKDAIEHFLDARYGRGQPPPLPAPEWSSPPEPTDEGYNGDDDYPAPSRRLTKGLKSAHRNIIHVSALSTRCPLRP
jgi:hypothetical protein